MRPNGSFPDYVSHVKNEQRHIFFPTVYHTSISTTNKLELTGKPRRRCFNYNPSQWNTLHFLLKIMIHFSNYESIIQMLDFFNRNILRNEIKSQTILPCPDRRVFLFVSFINIFKKIRASSF